MNPTPWGPDAGHFTALSHDQAAAQRVRDATEQLQDWARTRPTVNADRIYATCLCLAEPVPSLDVETLVAGVKVLLWSFVFDDLVDDGDLTPQQIEPLIERYSRIAYGRASAQDRTAGDPIAALLQDICEEFAQCELFTPARTHWAQALTSTMSAMLQEDIWRQQYRDEGTQPTLAAYLHNGVKSIAASVYGWTALIGLGDAEALQHTTHLGGQMRQAARCARLANDLRSYQKELSEGNVNAVTILAAAHERNGMAHAAAVEAARQQVSRRLEDELVTCDNNAHDVHTATGLLEQAIRNLARWTAEFYRRQGFLTCQPGSELRDHGWTSQHS